MNITEQLHYAMKRYACMAGAILVGIFGVFEVGAGRKIPRIFARSEQMGAAARWINRGSNDADAENERVRGGRRGNVETE